MDINSTNLADLDPKESVVYTLLLILLTIIALILNTISVFAFVRNKLLRSKEFLYYVALLSVVDWLNSIAYVITMVHGILKPSSLTSLQCFPIVSLAPMMLLACSLATICLTVDRYF